MDLELSGSGAAAHVASNGDAGDGSSKACPASPWTTSSTMLCSPDARRLPRPRMQP
jgi:hypothetical protein